jgi:glycosyltransferase involved in cell wall biosynthesis
MAGDASSGDGTNAGGESEVSHLADGHALAMSATTMPRVMVRVLHVVDTRQLRGGEVFASDLIRYLNQAGVSQRVAVLGDSGEGRVHYSAPEHLLGSDGWEKAQLPVRLGTLRKLQQLVTKWRPDLVQAHGGNTLKYTIPAVATRRTRVVYRKIGPTPPEVAGRVKRAGHAFLMRRADCVVAVGESVRRNTVDFFRIPANHVVTIPNAADPQRIESRGGRSATRRAVGIPQNSPVIISLGALSWEKDPLAHVEIGAQVLHQLPDAMHIMLGDGPMRSQVAAAIERNRLKDRILMVGARADVADFLTASDVLLFASRPDGMESMNASVIEAGMLGIPAAAYAVGGVPEIIVDGVTGRLISAGDVDGLATAVLELLSDPETRQAMGQSARESYLSRFDIRVVAPKYLELYEQLLRS